MSIQKSCIQAFYTVYTNMSIPSASAAQPLSRAARRAARNRAQTLVELIGADSGSYPTLREIDERINSWNAAVNPDLEMTPPITVISNVDLPTESSDLVTVNATSVLDNIRSPSEESALGHIMGIIRDGGFLLDEEPIQTPLIDALTFRLAPASVKSKSEEDLIRLDTDPNNLPVHPEILKLDPASSQYDPDNFDFTKIEVNRVVSPVMSTRTTVPLGSVKL